MVDAIFIALVLFYLVLTFLLYKSTRKVPGVWNRVMILILFASAFFTGLIAGFLLYYKAFGFLL